MDETDAFESSSIEHRIEDLHDAFADSAVTLILTVIGGFNTNQLLRYIDYDLIKRNPKRLCGFSDITALANAIYAKTGLVTYSGPHFINFGQEDHYDLMLDSFIDCHYAQSPYRVRRSLEYFDGYWATGQGTSYANPGWSIMQQGEAEGTIIGGNLCTLNLLHGTEYMPDPEGDIILFLEDDEESKPVTFDRDLQSLLHQPLAQRVKGLVIGRFESKSDMNDELLRQIIASKKELAGVPVISGVDFGHTVPLITFPIGGRARIRVMQEDDSSIEILKH